MITNYKIFESNNLDLHNFMCDFLSKIDNKKYNVSRYYHTIPKTLSFHKYSNYHYPIFTIAFENVNDKKLVYIVDKPKFKMTLDFNQFDDIDVSILKDFILDIFTKYSYFNSKNFSKYEFYINKTEIVNIMREINEFEIYQSIKKYNL
jgi:hypothetical protein